MNKVKLGPQTLVYPKPAFLVGADVDKKANFLAVAWGGVACGTPIISRGSHDTEDCSAGRCLWGDGGGGAGLCAGLSGRHR